MDSEEIAETLSGQLVGYWEGLIAASPRIAAAIVLIFLSWLLARGTSWLVRSVGQRLRMRRNLRDVLSMLAGIAVWLIGILITVTILFPSVTPGDALATLGLGSIAVGFAFKETFENFFAGILILFREPFRIGDYVECNEIMGQVEEITIRDTRIRKTDGQLVVMPNHQLFQQPVTVRTDRDLRRTTIVCGVAYGEDVDNARSVITRAIKEVDSVRDDVRDVQIFAQAFGSSSIDFEVTWWTGSRPIDIRTSRDQVVAAVKRALDDAGIEIPFPYSTLTFKEPLPIRRIGHREDRDRSGSSGTADAVR